MKERRVVGMMTRRCRFGSDAASGWVRAAAAAVALPLALGPGTVAWAADAGISAERLEITDLSGKNDAGAVRYLARLDPGIQKGASGSGALLDATLDVFYTDRPGAGTSHFDMPAWQRNTRHATYRNPGAPAAGGVRVAVVRPLRTARVIARTLGDAGTGIDLVAGGEPSAEGGLTAVLTIFNRNDGSLHRMCTRFAAAAGSRIFFEVIGGGAGRRLVARDGVPAPCPLDYGGEAFWLCKPGMAGNQCFVNGLDATEILPDGSTVLETHDGNETEPVDCFYVYPTVDLGAAGNHTDFSDTSLELDPLLSQVARLNASCRIFAPLYRQVTFAAFGSPNAALRSEIAYRDVKAAWDHYLAEHNGGRDFVIVGHSQGTFMLSRLMQEEIDPAPALRERLIVALLIGGRVTVPQGKTVGGTFESIPLCTADDETGCVIAYRSYAEEFPPAQGSNVVGPDDTACANPAALGGGQGFLTAYIPTSSHQPLFAVFDPPVLDTPFIKYENFYAAACVKDDRNRSYLEIRVRPGSGDVRENRVDFTSVVLGPAFLGTHILDYNFSMGTLVALVDRKIAAMP
jgi:hypothetical protein